MKLAILEYENFDKKILDDLNSYFKVELFDIKKINLNQILQEYDVVWLRLGYKFHDELFNGNLKCKIIVCPATGIDHLNPKICKKNDIKIISLKNESSFLKEVRSTAELTLLLTLSLLRKIRPILSDISQGKFNRDNFRGNDLDGKIVGVIGLGRLGKIVSDLYSSFGCKIIGFDIKKKIDFKYTKASTIEELVEKADIITIHVDLNEESINLIDKRLFLKMNPNVILINTSRSPIINSKDLIFSLKNNIIAGAALDVVDDELNFGTDNLFYDAYTKYENLIITPHIGGNTFESFKKTERFIYNKLIKELNG